MGVLKPELIFKSIVPIIMAGILGIYGLIVAVILQGKGKLVTHPPLFNTDSPPSSSWSTKLWWQARISVPRLRTLLRSVLPRKTHLSPTNLPYRLLGSLLESLVMQVWEQMLNKRLFSLVWSWFLSSPKPWVCMVWLSLLSWPNEEHRSTWQLSSQSVVLTRMLVSTHTHRDWLVLMLFKWL